MRKIKDDIGGDREDDKSNSSVIACRGSQPAQQKWVTYLTIMMQSVLFAAVRAPDGIRKDHPVKVIMRWYRRCILLSAFDGKAILDPFTLGGGSFTGPLTAYHFWHFIAPHRPWTEITEDWKGWEIGSRQKTPHGERCREKRQRAMDEMRNVYLRHVDELPHHFQLHLMHAAEIVGYYHPDPDIAEWWHTFYWMIVNDAHLYPESRDELALRLSDNPEEWRKREEVTAK